MTLFGTDVIFFSDFFRAILFLWMIILLDHCPRRGAGWHGRQEVEGACGRFIRGLQRRPKREKESRSAVRRSVGVCRPFWNVLMPFIFSREKIHLSIYSFAFQLLRLLLYLLTSHNLNCCKLKANMEREKTRRSTLTRSNSCFSPRTRDESYSCWRESIGLPSQAIFRCP